MHDHMRIFLVRGTSQGYFPELTKSILVISLRNVQKSEAHFRWIGVQVVTKSLYPCEFIGDQDSDKDWLAEKVEVWTHLVEVLAGVALRHPQTTYVGLQKSLQQEW